jgi:hypothetical protein
MITKQNLFVFIAICALLLSNTTQAQTDEPPTGRYKIAVFIPLYLDSVFDAVGNYNYGKTFPKYVSPALEFYEGVFLAADSLKRCNAKLDIHIIDTRSSKKPLIEQLNSWGVKDAHLMIGLVNTSEAKLLADVALRNKIPFISADLPNDAGITNNPFYVVLKSTLKTHCEGIYKFVQKNYSTVSTVVFSRKGMGEDDRLKKYIEDASKTLPGNKVNIKWVMVDDVNIKNLKQYLDSTRSTVSIVASRDENFGKKIVAQLAANNKTYRTVAIGMPTWDGIADFNKKDFKGMEIVYSTAFYNAKTDKVSTGIISHFKNSIYARPSDMVFRGYECMLRFGRLLMDKGTTLSTALGDKKYKVFTDFDIQPIINKQTNTVDYLENKKLYFIKKVDGVVKPVL